MTPAERTAPTASPQDRIEVLYNETCPICSREIDAYARAAERSGAAVDFVPLGAADLAEWGVDPEAARRRLHLRANGTVTAGLPAFAALWAALPGTVWLARLVSARPVRPVAAALYDHVLAPALYALDRRRRRRSGAPLSSGGQPR